MLRTRLTALCATTIVVGLVPGGYPGNGGTCGSTLAAGTSCQLVVVFAPQTAGTANSTINLGYDDTFASPQSASRAITGSGL